MIVYCQLGHAKFLKEGQLVEVYLNQQKLDFKDGDYLSAQAQRRTQQWYLRPIECKEGDLITLVVKTGLRTLGCDELRTFTAIFKVEGDDELSWNYPQVGYQHGFPLIKGKVKLIEIMTEKEKRLERLRAKLEDTSNDEPKECNN